MSSREGEKGDYVKLGDGNACQEQEKSSSKPEGTPLALWPIFCFAIFAGSTTAPVTYFLQRAAPISMTGWRHQITALLMLPFFIYESYNLELSKRKQALSWQNLMLLFLSALAIGGHLAAYTWAIYHTSIPHSVFLGATSPIYVALYIKLTGKALLPLELCGIFITFLGTGVFAIGSSKGTDNDNTYIGDFIAVIAAVCMAVYLIIGKSLRAWMPLFVFQFPIVVINMILLGVVGVILEGWNDSDTGVISGPFGWLDRENLWPVIWLAVVPGFFGQGGYVYVIKYAAPLVMPTGLCIIPVIASLLSWLLGQTAVPGVWTWIGAFVTFTGSMVVSINSTLRKTHEETKEHQDLPSQTETPSSGLEA